METTSPIQEIVQDAYRKYRDLDDGAVATHIPELGKANGGHFGIAVATVDGDVFTAGDWDSEFTIQSICKPFACQLRAADRS